MTNRLRSSEYKLKMLKVKQAIQKSNQNFNFLEKFLRIFGQLHNRDFLHPKSNKEKQLKSKKFFVTDLVGKILSKNIIIFF